MSHIPELNLAPLEAQSNISPMTILVRKMNSSKKIKKGSFDKYMTMLRSKIDLKAIVVVLCLNIGCFWQMVSICGLYLEYPTNIFIDTKFDVMEQILPAFTFCTNVGAQHRGRNTSSALFDMHFVNKTVREISVSSFGGQLQEVTEQYLTSAIESVSMVYYCFTINSEIKGIINILCRITL